MNTDQNNTSVTASNNDTRAANARAYVIAAIVCFVMASAVYLGAQPEEKTSPPRNETAQGAAQNGLPEGHPQTANGRPPVEALQQRIQDMKQVLQAAPDDPGTLLTLANTLYDLGQMSNNTENFAEAQTYYQAYLKLTPSDLDARTDMAYTMYRTGNVNGSIKELRTVIESDPRHQHAAFNLGLMYKEKDKPDSVLAYMALTARIDSTSNAGKSALQVLQAYQESH